MDFKKTEEQELLLDSLKTVMERGNFEDYFKECDRNHEYPQKAVDALVEAGFTTLGIPEEFGGTPTDTLTQVMVAEEAHALGYPSLCWINFATEVDDILTFGNKEQQEKILGYALEGKKPFTLGFTEPQAGSDSAAMATTATKRDGKVYINGNKTFNTSADRAPYMLCVCRSGVNESPYKDFSMYLFPMDRPGVAIEKLDKIGNNMCGTYEVHLDDVECEESDLVGEECKGFYQLMKNFEVERLTICAANVGMARCAYDEALRYAAQRMQFGKIIGSFQLVQEKLVDMRIKIENMQNLLYKTAWKKDNGESIMIDSSLVKRYTGQAAFEVIDDAMQIMGGIGYTHDCRISRLWRDQRVYRIMAGTEEIMVHTAGRALIKEAQ
ncbi:MAG: acyl-CoA dehydrogenase [Gordonibacter pamelaeae]|uniref:Acyl-CoA dehydrogenases n=2 Tax=Gordonibacter pamelaeae TaxID=471189 RepID=D6EA99_9ACTN|nr:MULTISPECIES: acyl-CoA dehydrogenase [Gordonibacter]MBS6975627.1 acyl-CoA dehydrogenase [Eggerthellaceae bacterium]MBS4895645.1 acyl-CoA dehydrogenase [Gordonibacter pamelaeae]MCB6312614.1 acyl-CoA dehydrogenase [Gordonibacter pamelaeae]MCB6561586.1 acyl-CoA dehydrogenase [Gordonibacter urolithinfaciens]RDB66537.1 acyl-CoA dehydrogenase [Gordonibacter pamelaeae]